MYRVLYFDCLARLILVTNLVQQQFCGILVRWGLHWFIASWLILFTGGVRPVCLPSPRESFPVGAPCWVTGWGYTKEGGESIVSHLPLSSPSYKLSFLSLSCLFSPLSTCISLPGDLFTCVSVSRDSLPPLLMHQTGRDNRLPASFVFVRFGVIGDEAGPGEGDRPVPVLTAKRLWLLPHSQNALCWLHGGRGGLLSGSYLICLSKLTNTWNKIHTSPSFLSCYVRLSVCLYCNQTFCGHLKSLVQFWCHLGNLRPCGQHFSNSHVHVSVPSLDNHPLYVNLQFNRLETTPLITYYWSAADHWT